jgi:alpha-beta hydrolase superfamily lysophospholipase
MLLLLLRLQGSMVEYAAYFHSKLVSNSLPGLPLPSLKVAQNIGLLGHSVGAGLATYVAQQAAAQQQPYKAVMYMAPQTQASPL